MIAGAMLSTREHPAAKSASAIRNRTVTAGPKVATAQRGFVRSVHLTPLSFMPTPQPKLKVGAVNDRYEQEADRVADEVLQMPEPHTLDRAPASTAAYPHIQRACRECEEELSSRSVAIQRMCPACKEELHRQPMEEEETVQTKRIFGGTTEITPDVQAQINRLRGSEQPLPEPVRAFFEPRFGHDFSPVRLHTDSRASEAARSVNARAFTLGCDIVFGAGQYSPGTNEGLHLLAHELTHVVQQGAHSTPAIDRQVIRRQQKVFEHNLPGGGRVESVREGEHLLWNFDVGSARLGPEHEEGIRGIAEEIALALKADRSAEVDLEGQASSTGTDPRNEALATERVDTVKSELVTAGIDVKRIRTSSVGSAKSLSGSTQEEFARSRAVRIILVPRLAPPARQSVSKLPGPVRGCPLPRLFPLNLDGGPVTLRNGILEAGDGKDPGMEASTTVFPPIPRRCGDFSFVQNVQPFIEIVYKDASRNRMEVSSWHLDRTDPYGCQNFGIRHQATDAPQFGVGAKAEGVIRTVEIRHEFRMFYLFKPTGRPRHTLQVGRWTWVAQARNTDPARGKLQLDQTTSRVIPSFGTGTTTGELPVTTSNVDSVRFVTDTRFGSTADSLAAGHLPFLNGPRRKARPTAPCGQSNEKGEPR